MRKSTKNVAVIKMIVPMIRDLVAAAPTYPINTSKKDIGADITSYTVPVNFGKKIPKEALEILCVSSDSIIRPGTINDP